MTDKTPFNSKYSAHVSVKIQHRVEFSLTHKHWRQEWCWGLLLNNGHTDSTVITVPPFNQCQSVFRVNSSTTAQSNWSYENRGHLVQSSALQHDIMPAANNTAEATESCTLYLANICESATSSTVHFQRWTADLNRHISRWHCQADDSSQLTYNTPYNTTQLTTSSTSLQFPLVPSTRL